MELRFITKKINTLADSELEKCSELYSRCYGKYSGSDKPSKKGERIKMGVSLYKKLYYSNSSIYISLCYKEEKLLGHAIFLIKQVEGKGKCSWVLQLVVDSKYRGQKIGSRLLFSAWGFSDFYAWGLATANAITLKTLETATWRQISISDITDNISVLEQLMDDVPFVEKKAVRLSKRRSQIFSNFYPELESSNKEEKLKIYTTRLGKIEPGYEWLAFTFASQPMKFTPEKFEMFLDFSDHQLKDAYSRMDMPVQPWTKGTGNEVDFILSHVNLQSTSKILDLGCGQGRHSLNLSSRGYSNVIGIDFSESNISRARQTASEQAASATFITADARKFNLGYKFDCVLCLYDVIGSFRKAEDNIRIIRSIKRNLKKGGYAVVSVMNMELTESIAINKASISENPHALLSLPPSGTMESSGNIFKPEYFIINTDNGLVYRKEQFTSGEELFAEYLVTDKRYTKAEITSLIEGEGMKVIESRYVQAGHWDTPLTATDHKAKEILLIMAHNDS